jgi:hypothetical protein
MALSAGSISPEIVDGKNETNRVSILVLTTNIPNVQNTAAALQSSILQLQSEISNLQSKISC